MQSGGGVRSSILNISIKDVHELYACYMPFVAHGGLFVATKRQFLLEDEVFVVLQLLDEPEKFPFTGKVVWITPPGVASSRKQGVGIQFSEDNADLVGKIETHLAGLLNTDRATHTL